MKRFYLALKWAIPFFACPLAMSAQTTVTEVVNGFGIPDGLALHSNTNTMFVSEYTLDYISMFDLNSSTPTRQTFIDLNNYNVSSPEGLLLDGNTLYFGTQGNGGIYKVDDVTATTPAVTQVAAIPGGRIFEMVKRIEGSRHWLYFADHDNKKISRIDLADADPASTLQDVITGTNVNHSALAIYGDLLYTNSNDGIYEADLSASDPNATLQEVAKIVYPTGMALKGNILYIADYTAGTVSKMSVGTNDYTVTQVADGLSGPLALSFHGNDLYVGEREAGSIVKFTPTAYTCPADISVTTALGEATAAVTYDDPVLPNSAWSFVRIDGPASGDPFPVGESTVSFVIKNSTGTVVHICTLTVNVSVSEWEKVGDFSTLSGFDGATDVDLAMDGDVPYIAYSNDVSGVSVAKFENGAWSFVGGLDFSPKGWNLDLEVHNDIPYIALGNGSVQHFVGNVWTAAGDISMHSAYMNLEIDGSGYPYMVSIDGSSKNVFARRFTGSLWNPVGTDGFASSLGQDNWSPIGLAFNSNVPYVAFQDANNLNRATVMTYNGASWAVVGGVGISNGKSLHRSLAIDGNNGDIYLAYADRSLSSRAVVKKYDGSQWSDVGDSQGVSVRAARNLFIEVDTTGVPYLALTDSSMDNRAAVLRYNGTEWASVGDAFFSEHGSYNAVSMALNSNGVPHVATFDGEHDSGNGSNIALWAYVPTELGIAGASVVEGDEVVFTLSLGRAINEDITVSLSVVDVTTGNGDYELPESPTVTLEKGHSQTTFEVKTFSDGAIEQTETFQVQITGAVADDKRNVTLASSLAMGTIIDDGRNSVDTEPDCDLLGLESDSFTVSVADETCTGKGNGSVTVTSSAQGTYLASLDNGTEQPIGNGYTFDELEPGEYRMCVRLYGSDCRKCYTATVREGTSIAAGTTAKDGLIAVSMRAGTAPYSVRVNGILRAKHSESEFTVAASGSDQVEIASALPCEGTLSLGDGLPENIIVYPNPVSDRLTVEGLQNGNMRFTVLTPPGNTVLRGEMEVLYRSAQLDVGMLGPGTYLLLIDQATGATLHRFIKI